MGQPAAVFKAYDIRGIVPEQLDAALCRAIGAAMARFTGAARLLVVRDMRPSGAELSAAFAEGARSQGTAVTDLGMASTDFLYFASGYLDAPGAMFTASHNPAGYNGIKLCLAGARPIGEDTGLVEIRGAWPSSSWPTHRRRRRAPSPSTTRDLLDEWATHVRSFVDVGCCARCGWWPTPPTGWAAWSCPG